jgi:hypothetical protein
MEIAIANNKLDNVGQWDGLAIQLGASVLAQGRPPTPLSPAPAPASASPAPAPPLVAPSPHPAPQHHVHSWWPWAPPIFIDLAVTTTQPWRTPLLARAIILAF